jgi:hypothetical protein
MIKAKRDGYREVMKGGNIYAWIIFPFMLIGSLFLLSLNFLSKHLLKIDLIEKLAGMI